MEKPPEELVSPDTQNYATRGKRLRDATEPSIREASLIPRHDEKELKKGTACSFADGASRKSIILNSTVSFTGSSFPRDPPTLIKSASMPSLNSRATCMQKAPVKTPVSAKSPGSPAFPYFTSTVSMSSPLSADASSPNSGSPKLVSRRQKWATLLTSTFMQSGDGYEEEKVKDICVRIVAAISGDGEEAKDTFLTLLVNLKDPKNGQLRSRVMKGVLPVEVLVTLSEVDLVNPERRKKLDEEFQQRARDTNLSDIQKACRSTSTLFQCPSCKARDCTWFQRQTRSGDEPMTVFCTCNVCGNTWRRS